jgi:hypothetical protein
VPVTRHNFSDLFNRAVLFVEGIKYRKRFVVDNELLVGKHLDKVGTGLFICHRL